LFFIAHTSLWLTEWKRMTLIILMKIILKTRCGRRILTIWVLRINKLEKIWIKLYKKEKKGKKRKQNQQNHQESNKNKPIKKVMRAQEAMIVMLLWGKTLLEQEEQLHQNYQNQSLVNKKIWNWIRSLMHQKRAVLDELIDELRTRFFKIQTKTLSSPSALAWTKEPSKWLKLTNTSTRLN